MGRYWHIPAEGLRALETLSEPIRGSYRGVDGFFFGYANNSRERSPDLYSLSSPLAHCSDKHKFLVSSGGFLGIIGPQTNFTIFTSKFCTPAYWSQSVKVTMEMTKSGVGRIVNVDRLKGKINPFNGFNITSFEELVATGRASPSENLFGDFPLDAPRAPETYKSYHLNPRSLESLPWGHEDAFKLLFALAVSSEFVDDSQNSTTIINSIRLHRTQAYVTNELWCRLSQVVFGVLSLLTFCLLVSTWNRKCNLDGEPNSLAALMQTLSQSPALRQKMENSEFRHPIDQRELLIESKSIYRLRLSNDQGPYIEVTDVEGKKNVQPESYDLYNEPAQKEGLAPVEMVWGPIGFLYTFYFTILLSLILFVYIADKTKGGLRFYAPESSFKFKLIFSHLPTITGTSIEPLWVLIGTYACMVAPYEILRPGHAPSSKTLTIDYDKTPPHFQTFQALKTGNFGLAALTIAIILANFLAVALGGLFSPRPFISTKVGSFQIEPLNITSNQFMGEDSYFLLAANLSGNALLPNWTVPEFYIMEFGEYGTDWVSSTVSMEAETLGFGTNISCELLPENEVIIRRKPTDTPNNFQLDVDHGCWVTSVSAQDNCQGSCSNETSTNTSTGFLIDSSCPGTFFVGWAEWLPQYTKTKATVLVCNSSMIISKVSATVDSLHQIVSYNKLGMISEADVDNMISRTLPIIPGTSRAVAFDDLFQKSISTSSNVAWIDVLMAQLQPQVRQTGNGTKMPDTTYVVEAFESAYRQLYAVNLRMNAEHDSSISYPRVDFDTIYNKTSMQYRVYVSTPMFSISLSIIISFVLLLLWVHIVRPGRGLTHLPRSMADTFTLLYASDAMEDCSQLRGENVRARGRVLDKMEDSYGYGLFKTPDGEEHFGVHKGSSSPDERESEKDVSRVSIDEV
ncbi:hypothetical protein P167DRAFT_372917 [Morchella conica CCBAS932]|uniref:Uncharacterized protein n=1 Tax=Morchella conica CCBAS932 TaxID=1392247 RepID=A0A3N4KBX8_9PEZI|nr:hypothetical protein P167DRAFT_372917 [Morchella conica CCBAS932]